jgi:hypothetical protein
VRNKASPRRVRASGRTSAIESDSSTSTLTVLPDKVLTNSWLEPAPTGRSSRQSSAQGTCCAARRGLRQQSRRCATHTDVRRAGTAGGPAGRPARPEPCRAHASGAHLREGRAVGARARAAAQRNGARAAACRRAPRRSGPRTAPQARPARGGGRAAWLPKVARVSHRARAPAGIGSRNTAGG